MLCVNKYDKSYIDTCRQNVERQLDLYRQLPSSLEKEAFEPAFLHSLVLVLDHSFVHRSRTLEKKDGNPLNEVRMMAVSILEHGGVMSPDNSIKYNPAKAVLQIPLGGEIRLTDADFERLFRAYFAEIEAKFS